jgi:menaquinone-dependent protoporphyrinogen oxidase
MGDKLLVTYATGCGSTAEVAEAIGEELRAGRDVDVRPVAEVSDLTDYGAVVLGSAIRAGRWLPEAMAFVEKHQEALNRVPVAYFIVCLTMREDTEENRSTAAAYLNAVREKAPQVRPVDVGLFAGALDSRELPFFMRPIVKAIHAPEGDFRDWDVIRAWAARVPAVLTVAPE